jgi:hypothetical protein
MDAPMRALKSWVIRHETAKSDRIVLRIRHQMSFFSPKSVKAPPREGTTDVRAGSTVLPQLCNANFILFTAAFLAFGMWFFVDRIWAPPGEVLSDLYPRWYGSRELLLHGRDPYGPAVSNEIQLWYSNHIGPELTKGPHDEHRFAYPVYIAFVLAPTIRLSFSAVEGLFRFILPALTLVSVPLWLTFIGWRCPKPILGALILLSLFNFPALESVYLQQPVLIAAVLLAGAAAALTKQRLALSGVLTALATIKPQAAALISAWLLFWALFRWKSRKAFVLGFGITMIVLLTLSEFLLPGWITEFLKGIRAYQQYTGNVSVLTLWLGKWEIIVAGAIILTLAVILWRLRHEDPGSDAFNFAFCFGLLITVVSIPSLYPTGQVLLVPAILLLLKHAGRFWGEGHVSRLSYVAAFSVVSWQWIGACIFLLASLVLPLPELRKFWLIPVAAILITPLVLLLPFAVRTKVLWGQCRPS